MIGRIVEISPTCMAAGVALNIGISRSYISLFLSYIYNAGQLRYKIVCKISEDTTKPSELSDSYRIGYQIAFILKSIPDRGGSLSLFICLSYAKSSSNEQKARPRTIRGAAVKRTLS